MSQREKKNSLRLRMLRIAFVDKVDFSVTVDADVRDQREHPAGVQEATTPLKWTELSTVQKWTELSAEAEDASRGPTRSPTDHSSLNTTNHKTLTHTIRQDFQEMWDPNHFSIVSSNLQQSHVVSQGGKKTGGPEGTT